VTPRKIVSFALGPIGAALLGVVTLPLITWFFSAADVGRMSMLQVAVSFSTLMFSLGLDQAYVREYHEAVDKSALLKAAMLPSLILLFISIVLFLLFRVDLAELVFGVASVEMSLIILTVLLAALVSRFLSLILRMKEKGLAYSIGQLLPKLIVLSIVGLCLVLSLERNLLNLVLANALGFFASAIFLIIYTRRDWLSALWLPVKLSKIKSMMRFGFPLIIGGLAYWGLTSVDRIFLRVYSSFDELAIYSVALSFSGAAVIIQSIFSTIWAPTVYKWASEGDSVHEVRKVARYILFIVVVLFCLAGLFSWIVSRLLPESYSEIKWILVSCIGAPLLYTLSEATSVGIGISRRSGFSMLAAVVAFVLNLFLNWMLVKPYGAGGAAVSTCVSFWVFFILRTQFSIYLWKSMPRLMLYGWTGIVVLGALLCTLYGDSFFYLVISYWLSVLLIALFFFKNEVFEIWGYLMLRFSSRVI
tara:strand:- start:7848 stop:9269 length:1422 start_codon:yes stop_codon:yes gene_type:complete